MKFLILPLDQELDVLSTEVEAVAEEIEPDLLLLIMRGLTLQVIKENIIFLFASRELVVCHLQEENYILPVKHGHQNFKEEFPLDLTHLKCLRY